MKRCEVYFKTDCKMQDGGLQQEHIDKAVKLFE